MHENPPVLNPIDAQQLRVLQDSYPLHLCGLSRQHAVYEAFSQLSTAAPGSAIRDNKKPTVNITGRSGIVIICPAGLPSD
jgi:hypothetical protein